MFRCVRANAEACGCTQGLYEHRDTVCVLRASLYTYHILYDIYLVILGVSIQVCSFGAAKTILLLPAGMLSIKQKHKKQELTQGQKITCRIGEIQKIVTSISVGI